MRNNDAWYYVHWAYKRGNPVNVEFLVKEKKVVDCIGLSKIISYYHYNGKYIKDHLRQKILLMDLIKKGCEIKYYNNFIEVDGIVFNGWNKDLINKLILEMQEPKRKEFYNIKDLEFEV